MYTVASKKGFHTVATHHITESHPKKLCTILKTICLMSEVVGWFHAQKPTKNNQNKNKTKTPQQCNLKHYVIVYPQAFYSITEH